MAWDPVWERIFRERARWGRYPAEELVRFMAAYYYDAPDRSLVRVLEVGCGPGSGASWFVAREGFSLSGIDASRTAIEKSRQRFAEEGITGDFRQGDIAVLPWPDASFDAVLDFACLCCNTEAETAVIIREIHRVLKPGGRHFSITPKAGCWGDDALARLDATTLASATQGPFRDLGKIRFATRESLERLYAGFGELRLGYSIRSAEGTDEEISHWVVACRK
jgi:SAM-dependent methyltransferase